MPINYHAVCPDPVRERCVQSVVRFSRQLYLILRWLSAMHPPFINSTTSMGIKVSEEDAALFWEVDPDPDPNPWSERMDPAPHIEKALAKALLVSGW